MTTRIQIEKALHALAIHDPAYKAFREKSTKMHVIGLRIPVIKTFVKEHSLITSLTPKEQSALMEDVWQHSTVQEALLVALYWKLQHKPFTKTDWQQMKHWIDRVDCWEHADLLSSMYSVMFEQWPNKLLPTFKQWNRSTNPWKQRISIVSLIYYATPKRTPPPTDLVLSMVTPLITSKDAYVQKGVGWTLRESYNIDPTKTYVFLKTHIHTLAPTSFSYATERVTPKQKSTLKQLRATNRPTRQTQKI